MKALELLGEGGVLHHKLRRTEDLIEHIGTSIDKTSNYSVLLGAGCSVTSGIESGQSLIKGWMREIYLQVNKELPDSDASLEDYFLKEQASWFNSTNPYASLFEKKYDLPSQRRRFVELQVDGRSPSIGYAYLVDLVNKGHLSTIFTTNFDDLIQESFYQFSSKRPIVCAHDSSVHSISITSSRPKIIKLHGDYLFDDIKSTLRETESLEQNIKDKLIEFCKEYGLVVLGYSGNDRSIMDILEFLTKQDGYLSNGLYWCCRPDDEINNTLQNLLWRDRVYPVIIDGFDEFFAAVHNKNDGQGLGVEANLNQSKIKTAIRKMIEDPYGLERDALIREELTRLKNMDRQTEISSLITSLSGEDDESPSLPMSDVRNLLEIEAVAAKGDIKKALELAEQDLDQTASDKAKPQYLIKLIKFCAKNGEKGLAVRWVEKLAELDSNNISYQLKKASFLESENKLEHLKRLQQKFSNNYTIANRYARALLQEIEHDPNKKVEVKDVIIGMIEASLALEPSLSNFAWQLKYDAIKLDLLGVEQDKKVLFSEHIDKAIHINSSHMRTLTLRVNDIDKIGKSETAMKVIADLYAEFEKASIEKQEDINELLSAAHIALLDIDVNDHTRKVCRKFFEVHLVDRVIERNANLLLDKAKYHIGHTRKHEKAKTYFLTALKAPDISSFYRTSVLLLDCFDSSICIEVKKLIESSRYEISDSGYFSMMSSINALEGEYDEALKNIERAYRAGFSLSSYLTNYSYICLLTERYDLIIEHHKRFKEYDDFDGFEAWKINYTYAVKSKGLKYNEVAMRNMSAQSDDDDVKLAAFAVLGNWETVKRMLKEAVENDYAKHYAYRKWPILKEVEQYFDDSLSA